MHFYVTKVIRVFGMDSIIVYYDDDVLLDFRKTALSIYLERWRAITAPFKWPKLS